MNILLAITFVYGVLRLLTMLKVFNIQLHGILSFIFKTNNTILALLDNIFFYFSLIFQSWYWLFNN